MLALGLPPFEVVFGGLLLIGVWRRTAAVGMLGLCGVFALALVSALLRGLSVDCGCLGGHVAPSSTQGCLSLVRDAALGAGSLIIYLKARH